MQKHSPAVRDLVLVGGGHTHALVLRMLAMKPIEGVRLTLISNVSHAPYSGMLPAHLAGIYSYDEIHIDLPRLAEFANAQFIHEEVKGLNLADKTVLFGNRPPIAFDLVSINIGSTPTASSIKGAERFATPVKPVPAFLTKWNEIIKEHSADSTKRLCIVGGGAGGTEMAFSARAQLPNSPITLIHRGDELLDTHNEKVRSIFAQQAKKKNIKVELRKEVSEIKASEIICTDNSTIESDNTILVTQASAASWVADAGLDVVDGGFLKINEFLQSTSHDFVFSTGDVATQEATPRPKSGVFAVRQAKPLLKNLTRKLNGEPLEAFTPQKSFLGLIGTGDKKAVASRGGFAYYGRSQWFLKDWIDRKFMRQFEELPFDNSKSVETKSHTNTFSSEASEIQRADKIRCRGCAAKVPGSVLIDAVGRDGGYEPEDAAELLFSDNCTVLQNIDVLPDFLADPYLLGEIAVKHSASDIYASGGEMHSALLSVTLPFSSEILAARTLEQVLAGARNALESMNATLLGGHSLFGHELVVSVVSNGLLPKGRKKYSKSGAKPGDSLILTKPLGTGLLFAAKMRGQAKGRWLEAAVGSMRQSNAQAAEILRGFNATAITDVTGFGLAGHLAELLKASKCSAVVYREQIATLPGATEVLNRGIRSSLHKANRDYTNSLIAVSGEDAPLLFSPETSGGLLICISEEQTKDCIEKLRDNNAFDARVIGTITPSTQDSEACLDVKQASPNDKTASFL